MALIDFNSGAAPAAAPTPKPPTQTTGTTAPDFFAPLQNASPDQLAAALRPNPTPPPGATAPSTTPAPAPTTSFDSDPGVAQARALENQGIGSLDSWLKAAREQAIIRSGDPFLASQAGFGLDPQAGVFARQNYLSGNADLARVDRAKEIAHRTIINRLAARGLLRSGDLGYQEGQSNIDYGNQQYDVRQNVLQKLSEFMQQYLDRKQALKNQTLGAYQTAYQNAASNPPSYGTSLFTAPEGSNFGSIDQYLWGRR